MSRDSKLNEDDRLLVKLLGLTVLVGLPMSVAFLPLMRWVLLALGLLLLVWVVRQRHYPRSDTWWVNALRSAVTALPFAPCLLPVALIVEAPMLVVPPEVAALGGAYAVAFLIALWELNTRPRPERRLGDDPVLGLPAEVDPEFAAKLLEWQDKDVVMALRRYQDQYRGGQVRALEEERDRRRLA